MFNERGFVDLERSGQPADLPIIDLIRANAPVDKPTRHQQVGGKGVGSLLDGGRGPWAAGMGNAPGSGAVEQHVAEFVRDSESPAGFVVVERMRAIDDDAGRETHAREGDPPDTVGIEVYLVDPHFETFADTADIHELVGAQHAEIFKKLRGETITIPMRDTQWFVAPVIDEGGEFPAILSATGFDEGIAHQRYIGIVKRGFDTAEHGDGRREFLDAWNLTTMRTMIEEVHTTDPLE